MLHQLRREERAAQVCTESALQFSAGVEYPIWIALTNVVQGWVLAEEGRSQEGLSQIRQGIAVLHNAGGAGPRSWLLSILAAAHLKTGQIEEGLAALAEALDRVDKTGERFYEAELYRLKGELTLQQESKVQSPRSKVQSCRSPTPEPRSPSRSRSLFPQSH